MKPFSQHGDLRPSAELKNLVPVGQSGKWEDEAFHSHTLVLGLEPAKMLL